MKAFIRGTGVISPQHTRNSRNFPGEIIISDTNLLRCIEPAYSEFLNPVMARRMGRVIKMGIASAMMCMQDSKLEMPDAIIAGTALGCLGDTEKFLKAMIADNEQFLTPTSFIQSIQNSVSAQIALQLNCTGHNFTFAHKGFSFESALLDALMLLENDEASNILVGGIDEMTDHNYFFYDKLGHWKKEKIYSSQLLSSKTPGTIGGEGAIFFSLSGDQTDADYASVTGVKMIYNPNDADDVKSKTYKFLNKYNLNFEEIDVVLYGNNGDVTTESWYADLGNDFKKSTACSYKHLCGEYQTSSAFAMWLGALILKTGEIPDVILQGTKKSERLSHVLIYNIYENNHSLILLQA